MSLPRLTNTSCPKFWLSYGSADGSIQVQNPKASEETATLLVYSQVEKWQRVKLTEEVAFAQLDAAVERLAKAEGARCQQALSAAHRG